MRLRYTLPIESATLNENHVADRVAANELVTLFDHVVDKRAIVARPHVRKLKTDGDMLVAGWRVQGMFYWRQGTNANWLLMAVAGVADEKATMYALLVDFSQSSPDSVIRQKIARATTYSTSALVGQHYNFVEYRGRVFVSNGFETCCFDGKRWTDWNQTSSGMADDWRRCATEIAFNTAVVFQDRAVLMGNRLYPNQILWTRIGEDWDEKTPFVGYVDLGGFTDASPTSNLTTISTSANLAALGGDAGELFVSFNGGRGWSAIDAPSSSDIKLLACHEKNIWLLTNDTDGFRLYSSDDAGENWTDRPALPSPVNVGRHMVFTDASNGFLFAEVEAIGHHKEIVYETTDGGVTWTPKTIYDSGAGDNFDISMVSATEGFVVSSISATDKFVHIYKRSSSGWTEVTGIWNVQMRGISALDANNAIVVGKTGKIYRTINGGTTWTEETSGTTKDLVAVVYYAPGKAIAVGTDATIRQYANGTWNSPTTNAAVGDLNDVTYNDNGRLYTCGDHGQLFYSDDDGINWTMVETETDKFTESLTLSEGEEIRASLKAFGNLLVFTDRNIYALHEQFGQQIVCAGVEVLNERCLAMYAGRVWFVGRYEGAAGVWAWDGSNPPALMSRRIQTTIDALTFEPSPKSIVVKFDTQGEFTPEQNGLSYNDGKYWLKESVLYLNRGSGGTTNGLIYSHGNYVAATNPTAVDTTGFYFPDIAAAGTQVQQRGNFGTLALELALNEDYVGTNRGDVYCRVQVRVAKSNSAGTAPDSTTWTTWGTMGDGSDIVPTHPGSNTSLYQLPHSGQGEVFASYVMPINHQKLPGYSFSNEPYRWLQFCIIGSNVPDGNNKSNWRLNRICLMPQVNLNSSAAGEVVSPSVAVWDDKLWVHFGQTIIVYSNGGKSVSTARIGSVNSSAVVAGTMVMGGKSSGNVYAPVYYTKTSVKDEEGVASILQTGRIDWSDVDPKMTDIPKILRRITVRAKPTTEQQGQLTVTWWADGNTSNTGTATLLFDSTHNPDGTPSTYQVRSIEPHSAPSSSYNYGTDFAVKLVGINESVDILGLTIEADTVRDDVHEDTHEA